jgi:hypothetical protein
MVVPSAISAAWNVKVTVSAVFEAEKSPSVYVADASTSVKPLIWKVATSAFASSIVAESLVTST